MDYTTDVRPWKLGQYESWGFPEVWVEVPDRRTPSRPRGRRPGLTIHLLERGAFRESPTSRAFPNWRAEAIHEAMNEVEPSAWTHGAAGTFGAGARGARRHGAGRRSTAPLPAGGTLGGGFGGRPNRRSSRNPLGDGASDSVVAGHSGLDGISGPCGGIRRIAGGGPGRGGVRLPQRARLLRAHRSYRGPLNPL